MKVILSTVMCLALAVSAFAEPCKHNHTHISSIVEDLGFVVTSTVGGRHNPGSKHYSGKAVDVSIRNQSPIEVELFMQLMSDMGYVVLDERVRPLGQRVWGGPHIHINAPTCQLERKKEESKNVRGS